MNLGPSEILVILVIALIVFGPRKLPELGKSLGSAMAQFRRASDDFKRSWEQEVELEKSRTSDDQIADTSPVSLGEVDRAADQLRELAERAARRNLRIGYEALAWGRRLSRLAGNLARGTARQARPPPQRTRPVLADA